jgi:hypothetical protein
MAEEDTKAAAEASKVVDDKVDTSKPAIEELNAGSETKEPAGDATTGEKVHKNDSDSEKAKEDKDVTSEKRSKGMPSEPSSGEFYFKSL